jgi:hypothetical protein
MPFYRNRRGIQPLPAKPRVALSPLPSGRGDNSVALPLSLTFSLTMVRWVSVRNGPEERDHYHRCDNPLNPKHDRDC